LTDIADSGLDASISVKPSQIGLDVSDECFEGHYREIVARAHELDAFVWCDMEDADTTDATLDAFESIAEEYPWSVGQCIQSNLKRTREDLDRLSDVPGKIRLVKGAYDEPEAIAHKEQSRVDEAYREDLRFLFERRDRGIAVGSHDPAMISLADRLARGAWGRLRGPDADGRSGGRPARPRRAGDGRGPVRSLRDQVALLLLPTGARAQAEPGVRRPRGARAMSGFATHATARTRTAENAKPSRRSPLKGRRHMLTR